MSTRLLAIALAFVLFYYVPTTRRCDQGVKIREEDSIVCAEPSFEVGCRPSSTYRALDETAFFCRTRLLRPVRVVDAFRQHQLVCESTLGWLASYRPNRGCYCDYYTTLDHGVCVLTDETCRALFGTGATARTNELGYPDQCVCRRGDELLPATSRCDGPSPQQRPGGVE
jgi:hypothetical protein